MCARFTVLNETPIASAIAGCVIPLSRSSTICMRSRCAAGIFHRSAVFNCRICFLVHLTIRPPESDSQSESYCAPSREPEKRQKSLDSNSYGSGIRSFLAIWPFGGGRMLKRIERNLYEEPEGARVAFVDEVGSESYWATPALRMQRVPWFLDVRWIAPALIVSTAVMLLTLLASAVAALWRLWHKKRWSPDGGHRRKYLVVKLVLLIDAVVIVAAAVLFIAGGIDPRI